MRSEVADHAVGLVHPQVHARGGDEVDLAEVVLADQVAHLVDRRAVEERVSGHEHETAALGQLHERFGLCDGGGERLLHEHVLAGLERLPGESEMGARRRRNCDRVDAWVVEQRLEVRGRRHAGIATRKLRGLRGIELAQREHLELRALDGVADDVGTPVAVAHDGETDGGGVVEHHAVPLP